MPLTHEPGGKPDCDCTAHCGDDPRLRCGGAAPCQSLEEIRRFAAAEQRAWRLADEAARADIETMSHRVVIDGRPYWDTRPMLDPREHPEQVRDQAAIAIDHALDRKLFERHPQRPHLLYRTARA